MREEHKNAEGDPNKLENQSIQIDYWLWSL